MITYDLHNGRPTTAATNNQLTDEQVVETLNRQATRIRELETWFRLLAGTEPTFENFMALKLKPGHDAVGRRLRPRQIVAAFPQILGAVIQVNHDLVQIRTSAGDIHNLPAGQVLMINDPSAH